MNGVLLGQSLAILLAALVYGLVQRRVMRDEVEQ